MRIVRSLNVVDSHTVGEPTRIVTGGIPSIPGATMADKRRYLETHLDNIRTSIMHEPRGHKDMFGSILTAPVSQEADFGIIFMDGGGYLNMCGHGSIGAVTVAIETGIVPMVEPFTQVIMDTPAGLVRARGSVQNGKVKEVSVVNVPAFLWRRDLRVEVPDLGPILVDIAFGGNFFAILDGRQLGIPLEPRQVAELTALGLRIRDAVNRQVHPRHPLLEHIDTVDLVEIYGPPASPGADARNVVVFGQGQVDRSPCGTGTSAKLADLHARGELREGESFTYESILGTRLQGRIIGTTKVGPFVAVIPEITGSAYITGFNQFVIDPDDPVAYGFVLK
jgi:proline racemase